MNLSSESVEFLIVDDDAPLSGFFRAYLESKGMQLKTWEGIMRLAEEAWADLWFGRGRFE